MKRSNALYYLLFILLITGAFASMAQNSYGTKIIGLVAFAFSGVFIFELFRLSRKPGKKDPYYLAELVCLVVLSLVFGLRVFYIHFPNVELIFVGAGIVLLGLYIRKMILSYRDLQGKNAFLARLLLAFHLSLVLFLISMVLVPFAPNSTQYTSAAAIVLLLIFLIVGFMKRDLLVEGEKNSAFSMVRKSRDHSILIMSIFALFSLYIGLNKIGLLPSLYADEYPKSYYELVNEATTKQEKSVDGKYKHELFKEKYEQLLKNIKKYK